MKKTLMSLALATLISTSLFADTQLDTLKEQIKALEEKTDALLEETADSKVSDSFGEYNGISYAGMAPGASKVYTNKNKLSIGGYGKVDYINYLDSDKTSTADAYRAVLYFGYRFTDNIILNMELEFEHGGSDRKGSTEVEMLALDFLVNDALNFRVGTYVLPIGLVNVNHEPTLFNTVLRPRTEVTVIPSTWFENGGMVYGSFMNNVISYKTGIVAGLDASLGGDVRHMRSKGSKSAADDAGYFVRLDVEPNQNINFAGSYYFSNAGQGTAGLGDVDVNLYEVHAIAKFSGFEAKALYAYHKIGSAKALAEQTDGTTTEEAFGYYANLNYTYGEWVPFVQYEVTNQYYKGYETDLDTTTTTKSNVADSIDTTIGINWKPHPQVVLKADYVIGQAGRSDGTQRNNDRFELGMGFVF